MSLLSQPGIAFEAGVGWREIVADLRFCLVAAVGEEDPVALVDEVVCGAGGERLDGKAGIG